jgi:hypothetical protein
MKICQANSLGQLCHLLGIDPAARLGFEREDNPNVFIELKTGTQYTFLEAEKKWSKAQFQLPQSIKDILSGSDDQLRKRWKEISAVEWNDEHETIHSELAIRGISTLGL